MVLEQLSEVLSLHFRGLADRRPAGPIYLLEHPLTPEEVERLRKAVFLKLKETPLSERFWELHSLSVCLLAAEVGYHYRGTGTNFWPVLAQDLGISATSQERARIVQLFEKIALRYRVRRPGTTVWERHFPLIAWPVGNAVAPMEIHVPLARALQRALRQGVRPSASEAFLDYMQEISRGLSSVRFSAWLENTDIALEVANRLLGVVPEEAKLPAGLLARISEDVAQDWDAQRYLAQARSLAKRQNKKSLSFTLDRSRLLYFVEGVEGERLMLQGPTLTPSDQQTVASALNLQGDWLAVRGADKRIKLWDFLAGGVVPLPRLTHLDSPLFLEINPVEYDDAARKILDGLEPYRTRILERYGDDARYISIPKSKPLNEHADYCLYPEGDEFQDESKWKFLSPYIEPERIILSRHLSDPRPKLEGESIVGLGALGGKRRYLSIFPIIGGADSLLPQLSEVSGIHHPVARAPIEGINNFYAPLPAGRWKILEDEEIEVVEPPAVAPAKVQLDPIDMGFEEFLNGSFTVRITAPVPLENISLKINVLVRGKPQVNGSVNIARLPGRLSGFSPAFREIRALAAENLALKDAEVIELHLIAENLCSNFVELHRKPVSFFLDDSGHFIKSDAPCELFSILEASPDNPVLQRAEKCSASAQPKLLVPDTALPGALSSGVLSGLPKNSKLSGRTDVETLRWCREPDSTDECVGLYDVSTSLVAWKMAFSENAIGSFEKARAVRNLEATSVAQLCGETWSRREQWVDTTLLDPMDTFLHLARIRKLTEGPSFPNLPSWQDRNALQVILRSKFGKTMMAPEVELAGWGPERGGEFDLIVSYAYDELAAQFSAAGRPTFDEVDVAHPPTRWRDLLFAVTNAAKLTFFNSLILPADRWTSLSEVDFSTQTPDATIDLLDSVHVDVSRQSGRRHLGREEIRTLFLLWLQPEKLEEVGDWKRPLMKCLSDTFTSRAVRYAVLRHRLVEMNLPGEGGF